jgi:hypothetical protein
MAKKRSRKKTSVKKSSKKKAKTEKTTRYIPKAISDAVKKQHFFECAWCAEPLTERHHIEEFSEGGDHTKENLILLCPVCHTKVHQGKISKEELIERKSTHKKADRMKGGFKISVKSLKFIVGGNSFTDTPVILRYNLENVIYATKQEDNILVNLRFYNKEGDLIFWMSENHYWTLSDFVVTYTLDKLEITNKSGKGFFKMWKQHDALFINGENYLNGRLCTFDENGTNFSLTVKNTSFSNQPFALRLIYDYKENCYVTLM